MSEFSLSFVEEFVDVSQRCTQPIELRDALMAHVSKFGFENLAATNIGETPSIVRGVERGAKSSIRLGTYPDSWMARFFEKSYYEVDPVSKKVNQTNTPFYWQDCNKEFERLEGRTKRGKQFLAEASEIGLVRGVTVPIVNQGAKTSINLCGKYAIDGAGVMHMLHLVAIYFHQRLLALGSGFTVLMPYESVKLTPREEEVLCWYAQGKSAWDISEVLQVSESAIRFHLSNIRSKYGVASSVHATALAISRSDIQV